VSTIVNASLSGADPCESHELAWGTWW